MLDSLLVPCIRTNGQFLELPLGLITLCSGREGSALRAIQDASRLRPLMIKAHPCSELHPREQIAWIEDLVQGTLSSQESCLLWTYSDHILNGLRLCVRKGLLSESLVKVAFFRQRPDRGVSEYEVVYPQMNHDGRLDTWPDGFFDTWEYALRQLLPLAKV